MDFLLQPNIYSTENGTNTLMSLLERAWVKDVKEHDSVGNGTFYILSGFSNFNGGVPFYERIEKHIQLGGKCKIILGASASQRMSSQQIVRKLLEIGCEVGLVNRKAIFHAKCYGFQNGQFRNLIVSSGNFTSRGITQNIEASLFLQEADLKMKFEWETVFDAIKTQKLEYYQVSSDEANDPAWKLLFDEDKYRIEEGTKDEFSTMVLTLGHNDTVRIQAEPRTNASKGSQYFWLSKDAIDFFPRLNIENKRGTKKTYSTFIKIHYLDIGRTVEERVTLEAENNLDFRLGTGTLRNTQAAYEGDIALITRKDNAEYELRIVHKTDPLYSVIIKYAIYNIGNRGKRYGYIANSQLMKIQQSLL